MGSSPIKAKYVGPTQHTRVLTEADQEMLGAKKSEINGPLIWDALHGHVLDVSNVAEPVLDHLRAHPNSWVVGTRVTRNTKAKDDGEVEQEDLRPIPGAQNGPGTATAGGVTTSTAGSTSTATSPS